MKCPKCATSQTRRDGMTCKSCQYQYVFDPKADGVTDGKFMALIEGASAKNTYYFTMNQLYARYCRGREQRIAAVMETLLSAGGKIGRLVVLLGIGVAVVGGISEQPLLFVVGVIAVLGGVVAWFAGRSQREVTPEGRAAASRAKLVGWVSTWKKAGRSIDKLLETPSLDKEPGPYREGDIYDYGVERVLVVQHDLLVDLFVKNNYHADQRALVISEHGYPSYLMSHAKRLLGERPDLPVVLLHDATPAGVGMKQRLEAGHVLPLGGRRVIDAGLFPNDVPKLKALGPTVPEASGNAVPVDLIAFGALAGGLAGIALLPQVAHGALPPPPDELHAKQAQQKPGDSGSSGGDGSSAGDDTASEHADFSGSADFGGDADFG